MDLKLATKTNTSMFHLKGEWRKHICRYLQIVFNNYDEENKGLRRSNMVCHVHSISAPKGSFLFNCSLHSGKTNMARTSTIWKMYFQEGSKICGFSSFRVSFFFWRMPFLPSLIELLHFTKRLRSCTKPFSIRSDWG